MNKNKAFNASGVGMYNSVALLDCDYATLRKDVSRAVIECPAIISLFRQRDLSMLTAETTTVPEIHMRACLRMTCAFIGIKDPYPERKSAV